MTNVIRAGSEWISSIRGKISVFIKGRTNSTPVAGADKKVAQRHTPSGGNVAQGHDDGRSRATDIRAQHQIKPEHGTGTVPASTKPTYKGPCAGSRMEGQSCSVEISTASIGWVAQRADQGMQGFRVLERVSGGCDKFQHKKVH